MPATQTQEDVRAEALALHEALTDLVRAYHSRDREAICCYDVSLVQSQALERLARRGPMSMRDFAAALFLEKSSASRLVAGLERKGYVVRRPGEDDARFVRVELTKSGRTLARRLEDDLVAERSAVLSELSASQRRVVVRSLEKLAHLVASGATTHGTR